MPCLPACHHAGQQQYPRLLCCSRRCSGVPPRSSAVSLPFPAGQGARAERLSNPGAVAENAGGDGGRSAEVFRQGWRGRVPPLPKDQCCAPQGLFRVPKGSLLQPGVPDGRLESWPQDGLHEEAKLGNPVFLCSLPQQVHMTTSASRSGRRLKWVSRNFTLVQRYQGVDVPQHSRKTASRMRESQNMYHACRYRTS